MSDYFTREDRVRYGTALEPVILPKISAYLNDKIQKTEYQFSFLDFQGHRTWAELKVRTSDYHHTDSVMREGWLLPACKIREAERMFRKGIEVYFFYLWERDGSFWVYKYNPKDFATLVPRVPSWHKDKQLHYFVPTHLWKLIDKLKIDWPKRVKKCLITDDDD
jgi:hypothetical protein